MNAHEAITLAVNNAVSAIQAAVDTLAAKANEHDDDELVDLANRLQNSVSALSNASTRHGVEIAPTGTAAPATDTISGAGGQPTSTTNDTVQGAGALTQGGAASFADGTPAQGDQTGTVSGAGGNDTVSGEAATSRRR